MRVLEGVIMNIGKYARVIWADILTAFYNCEIPMKMYRQDRSVATLKHDFQKFSYPEKYGTKTCSGQWIHNAKRLKNMVLTRNVRKFLRWDVVRRTMFVTNSGYLKKEFNFLQKNKKWASVWRKVIEETSFGYPSRYIEYPRSSGNLIHHAYHLAKFEEKTGIDISKLKYVFEFGGGYGSMCRVFQNSGFTGKYIIFDLPEFVALQRFYLRSIGITVETIDTYRSTENAALCIFSLGELRSVISDLKKNLSIFIATWSVSEASVEIRDAILSLVEGFDAFLLAYQDKFKEVDNAEFFSSWKSRNDGVNWYNWQIEHIPGSYYLMGRKKPEGIRYD